MECPTCSGSLSEVIESTLCKNGTRRRRHACAACGYRWTTWDGPKPRRGGGHPRKNSPKPHRQPLTPEQVKIVLLSTDSHASLGRLLDRSGENIRQIRAGDVYANIHPEIARVGKPEPTAAQGDGPICYDCEHWQGRCTFGFPDMLVIGPTFAAECELYAAPGGS